MVQGEPLDHAQSTLSFPVLTVPHLISFTEIVSIVKREVFDGRNSSNAVAFNPVAICTEYVPFAEIASQDTPHILGVTVPAVRAEIVNTR